MGSGQQADFLEDCIFQMGIPADITLHVRWHSAQYTLAEAPCRTQQVLYNMEERVGNRMTYLVKVFSS